MAQFDHDQIPASPVPRRFQTTRWSLVAAAKGVDEKSAREALAALCEAYWYPLYAFVRRKGYNADDALDLVQGFFARLLERGDLGTVERGRGRLRSFLMVSCTHYLANRLDHERARKRGGDHKLVAIDGTTAEGRYSLEPSHEMTAERLFEQRWATTLLGMVLGRLEDEMATAGKARQFAILRPALSGDLEARSYTSPSPCRVGHLGGRGARRLLPPLSRLADPARIALRDPGRSLRRGRRGEISARLFNALGV